MMMIEQRIYRQDELPESLMWQAVSFMRVQWPSIFKGSLRLLKHTYPPDMGTVHFTISEEGVLLSYASVMRIDLSHAGERYTVHGFGNAFTFPPYRGEGLGRQVVEMATAFLRDSDADVAGLFCAPGLERFYAASGWEALPGAITRVGTPERFTVYSELRMMLFLSEKGRQARTAFAGEPLYVPWPW
ncbi:GNAT family N-acetyltransferase [Sorangium sp. So ce1128]